MGSGHSANFEMRSKKGPGPGGSEIFEAVKRPAPFLSRETADPHCGTLIRSPGRHRAVRALLLSRRTVRGRVVPCNLIPVETGSVSWGRSVARVGRSAQPVQGTHPIENPDSRSPPQLAARREYNGLSLSCPMPGCKGFALHSFPGSGKVPLLRRLLWPLLLLPCAGAAAVLYAGGRAGASSAWIAAALLLPLTFGLVYASLVRLYQQWSQPPAPGLLEGAMVPPEPVVLVSRGGFLTPGSAFFTRDELLLFAGGRRIVTLPLERVADVELFYGKMLRTPYLDFLAADGRRLGRLAVEGAETWAPLLRQLCLRRR